MAVVVLTPIYKNICTNIYVYMIYIYTYMYIYSAYYRQGCNRTYTYIQKYMYKYICIYDIYICIYIVPITEKALVVLTPKW
jgi:hypothetical protein